MIKEARNFIPELIWGRRKGIGWDLMAKLKEVGGLGLRDPKMLVKSTMIRPVWRIWTMESSLWVRWMMCHYVKGKGLNEIEHRAGDLLLWTVYNKSFMRAFMCFPRQF